MQLSFKIVAIFFGVVLVFPAFAGSLEQAELPSLISSLRGLGPLEFCDEGVPLEVQDVRERLEKELMLTLWDRPQVLLWLKRSRRYLPHIDAILKENGMPEDLKFVAIAESALRPHAGSRKGAIGFWQFMAQTGRKYGLVIDERIDERRNLFASTGAAVRYLKELHKMFGSWTLVAAAYNMGEEGLMAEILEQETRNYYALYLPLETQRFVFRILAAKLIFSHPENYGFVLKQEDYYTPLAFDKIQVDCFQETPIRIIARSAGTTFKMIKDLNPQIRGHYLAAGSHHILIPKGTSQEFHERFKGLVHEYLALRDERVYFVKEGDNLSVIAERFDVPLSALLIWNRLEIRSPIHPGDRLIIHPKAPASAEAYVETEDKSPEAGSAGEQN